MFNLNYESEFKCLKFKIIINFIYHKVNSLTMMKNLNLKKNKITEVYSG
jgi:hypothetical protein